jgi:hypothetical protein
MNVGLPGTGIGGVFYLLSAICMPVVEAARAVARREATQWRVVGRQLVVAIGIIAGIWWAGWILALMVGGSPLLLAAIQGGGLDGRFAPNVLRTATLAVSLSTLGILILSVWVASLVVHGRRAGRNQAQGTTRALSSRRKRGRLGRKVAEYDAA